jgi:hypothetical protein
MPKIILILLLTASTTSSIATKKADAEQAVRDEIACYNVITGRTFSAAECDLREEGESNNEFDCKFGPGFLESRGKPVQAFSSPICAEAKVEFRQCVNGTMLGSYQYPNCQ